MFPRAQRSFSCPDNPIVVHISTTKAAKLSSSQETSAELELSFFKHSLVFLYMCPHINSWQYEFTKKIQQDLWFLLK